MLAEDAAYGERSYATASWWLLRAIRENQKNLDNWMDLAFALRHAGVQETSDVILFLTFGLTLSLGCVIFNETL